MQVLIVVTSLVYKVKILSKWHHINMISATKSITIKHGISILNEKGDFEDWIHGIKYGS